MLDFRIILEARNPARRCSRRYRVEAGTDLFGSWVVEITYGRIGTAGRSRCYVVRDEEEARHLARSILKRRATAPRRIGAAYRIRELIDPEDRPGSIDNAASEAGTRFGPVCLTRPLPAASINAQSTRGRRAALSVIREIRVKFWKCRLRDALPGLATSSVGHLKTRS